MQNTATERFAKVTETKLNKQRIHKQTVICMTRHSKRANHAAMCTHITKYCYKSTCLNNVIMWFTGTLCEET